MTIFCPVVRMVKQKNFSAFAQIHNISEEDLKWLYLDAGDRIGPSRRYEIVSLIGTGNLGVVYLAKDEEHPDQIYALKLLYESLFRKQDVLDILIDCISNQQDSPHDNLLEILDFWKQKKRYFYTMEYVEGPSLYEWLGANKSTGNFLQLREILQIISQVCRGLAHLHKNFFHGSIHPGNILLENSVIKISDFGFQGMRLYDFWQKPYDEVPCNIYRSPEQRRQPLQADKRSDIYAVGMILYEMLTYSVNDTPAQLVSIRSDIPQELEHILERALHLNPAERYSDIMELVEELERLSVPSSPPPAEEYAPPLYDTEKYDRTRFGNISEREAEGSYDLANKRRDQVSSNDLEPVIASDKELEEQPDEKIIQEESIEQLDSPEDYFIKAKEYEQSKDYPRAIQYLERALEGGKNGEIEESLKTIKTMMAKAKELKQRALAVIGNPYEAYDYISESVFIYPHDYESQSICRKIAQDMQQREISVRKLITKGDTLAESEQFIEAIELWHSILGTGSSNKEIEDRIMQVVDMVAERAQHALDQGECYEAQNMMEKVICFSQDPFIHDLHDEIEQEVGERDNQFNKAFSEAEKHFEKKQYIAAAQVWESIRGITPKDDFLAERISEARRLDKKTQEDEEEYLGLTSIARTLEQKGDYAGALQAWERIRQRQWACPISDARADIERVSKMAAAVSGSEKANKRLLQIEKLLDAKKLKEVEQMLQEPVFQRKLLPDVEKRLEIFRNRLEEEKICLQRRTTRMYIIVAATLIVIALGYFIWFMQ